MRGGEFQLKYRINDVDAKITNLYISKAPKSPPTDDVDAKNTYISTFRRCKIQHFTMQIYIANHRRCKSRCKMVNRAPTQPPPWKFPTADHFFTAAVTGRFRLDLVPHSRPAQLCASPPPTPNHMFIIKHPIKNQKTLNMEKMFSACFGRGWLN